MKRFSAKRRILKMNLKDVPSGKPGVYLILSRDGEEVEYVGKSRSGDLPGEIWRHRGHHPRKMQLMFRYRTVDTRAEADALEKEMIRKHIPCKTRLRRYKAKLKKAAARGRMSKAQWARTFGEHVREMPREKLERFEKALKRCAAFGPEGFLEDSIEAVRDELWYYDPWAER